mmetsp:Transcript_81002/g.210404  ORF Transcript_81002/g.210404 Transcript_81002/m.210404 type:complete len:94 (-) Transcript_81002:46-327(-)
MNQARAALCALEVEWHASSNMQKRSPFHKMRLIEETENLAFLVEQSAVQGHSAGIVQTAFQANSNRQEEELVDARDDHQEPRRPRSRKNTRGL